MKNRTLNFILVVLGATLAAVLFASERGVSRLMEACGELISNTLGF